MLRVRHFSSVVLSLLSKEGDRPLEERPVVRSDCVCVAALMAACFTVADSRAAVSFTYSSAYARSVMSSATSGTLSDDQLDDTGVPANPSSRVADADVFFVNPPHELVSSANAFTGITGDTITGQSSMSRQWSMPPGQSANASSTAESIVHFSLTSAASYLLTGNWISDGPLMAGLSFTLHHVTTGTNIIEFGGSNVVANSYAFTGTLAAGDYELRQAIEHSANGLTGDGMRSITMDYVFTVPTPGAGATLAALCLGGLRRRR